jgi:D-xylose transport system substrate-binding protein
VTGAADWAGGEKKVTLKSIFLKPVPVTRANLDLVLKAGHIKKAALCKGVTDAAVTACK